MQTDACARAHAPQTPIHYDDNNFGLTFLIAFDVQGGLRAGSGSHVLASRDLLVGVQVRDSVHGVVTLGDYRRILHANRAVEGKGSRLIMTAYCSQTLVDRVATY